jgi:transposase
MRKTDVRRLSPSAQEALRYLLVAYLKKGHTQREAAEVFGFSLIAVKRIWKRYKEGGRRALACKRRGVKGKKRINAVQAAETRRLIKKNCRTN